LIELNKQLREFDLLLNHKKTEIEELPTAAIEQWVRQLNTVISLSTANRMDYKAVQAYFDSVIDLMQSNKENAAIINYALKALKDRELTDNAKQYCIKTVMHLSIIYPYLIPLMDEYIFEAFNADVDQIKDYATSIYKDSFGKQNYEGVYYAIYFAIKYDLELNELTSEKAIETEDCLVLVFAYTYFRKRNDVSSVTKLEDYAKKIDASDFNRYWIFKYEILSENDLIDDDWNAMKKNKVTFLAI